MAFINSDRSEVEFKIVLHGPDDSGKRTILDLIENAVESGLAREWMYCATAPESRQLFGFLPLQTRSASGEKVRFNIFTLPRESGHSQTCRHLAGDMDAAIFVFDSRWSCMERNRQCLNSFRSRYGLADSLPLVYLYNKTDLRESAPRGYMDFLLNNGRCRVPSFETDAVGGQGVFEGLNAVAKLAAAELETARKGSPRGYDAALQLVCLLLVQCLAWLSMSSMW